MNFAKSINRFGCVYRLIFPSLLIRTFFTLPASLMGVGNLLKIAVFLAGNYNLGMHSHINGFRVIVSIPVNFFCGSNKFFSRFIQLLFGCKLSSYCYNSVGWSLQPSTDPGNSEPMRRSRTNVGYVPFSDYRLSNSNDRNLRAGVQFLPPNLRAVP